MGGQVAAPGPRPGARQPGRLEVDRAAAPRRRGQPAGTPAASAFSSTPSSRSAQLTSRGRPSYAPRYEHRDVRARRVRRVCASPDRPRDGTSTRDCRAPPRTPSPRSRRTLPRSSRTRSPSPTRRWSMWRASTPAGRGRDGRLRRCGAGQAVDLGRRVHAQRRATDRRERRSDRHDHGDPRLLTVIPRCGTIPVRPLTGAPGQGPKHRCPSCGSRRPG